MITVRYTLEELRNLTTLIDIAVKQEGLKVAGVAFMLHQKHALSLDAKGEQAEAKAEQPSAEIIPINIPKDD